MAELQTLLVSGTFYGTNGFTHNIAPLYPWNRSDTTFTLPTIIADKGVHQILSDRNTLHVHAGTRGYLYSTNLSDVTEPRELNLLNQFIAVGSFTTGYPGAIAKQGGKVLYGVSNGTLSGSIIQFPYTGVYSQKNKALVIENTTSAVDLSDWLNHATEIGLIFPLDNDQYLVGWQVTHSGVTQGIDKVGVGGYLWPSYGAYTETDLRPAGSGLNPRTFQRMRVTFTKELTGSSGIRISYRKNLNDSYTTLTGGTVNLTNYPNMSSNTSIDLPFNFSCDFIQLKIELTTGTDSQNGPELLEVRLT
jgi:hypothetical protein